MNDRLRLVVFSHILPFPEASGQQQRVRYTLEAAREVFHVTFVTCAASQREHDVRKGLVPYCDASIILPALYARTAAEKWKHRVGGVAYAAATGEKRTNYAVGRVEFSPDRVSRAVGSEPFDVALFEYWYAAGSVGVLRSRSIPSVLDMHNILWKAYERQLAAVGAMPGGVRRWAVRRYRRREERSWREFDGVVAINREEEAFVRSLALRPGARIFYAPMGVDLARWPYSWKPERPIRVGFYGGLASPENQDGALRCHREIMPRVWERFPDAELWLVGSHPPTRLQKLSRDPRVKVTGFLPDVGTVLASLSCVVCPWSGAYGFRSRLVEVMSLGVPTVASRNAVRGMELDHGNGILLAGDDGELARLTLSVLENEAEARNVSRAGRGRVEALFTAERSYGRWMGELRDWVSVRSARIA